MTPDDIAPLFTRSDGSYLFARWGRPIVPIVFGLDDATLGVVKGAIEAVCLLANHPMAETDPELGANLMVFFFRDWQELTEVPDLGRIVPEMERLIGQLQADGANQYRLFRFDPGGAIRACFVFLCMDADLSALPAETLALGQVVQSMLLWSDRAFRTRSPLGVTEGGAVVLRAEIAQVIQAAYDPVMPGAATDASHALRLAARLKLPS